MRAVQSADYAMGGFRCLWKLVLFHGRMNYIRISECILYFFYKNMILMIVDFLFAIMCLYSAQSIYNPWYVTCFNVIFTFFPVIIRAVFEEDLRIGKWNDGKIPGKDEIKSPNY